MRGTDELSVDTRHVFSGDSRTHREARSTAVKEYETKRAFAGEQLPAAMPSSIRAATLAEGRRNDSPDIHGARRTAWAALRHPGWAHRPAGAFPKPKEDRLVKSETKKLFMRLKELSAGIKRNTYESVKVATEILADHDWVAEQHSGDDDNAIEAIQSEYFGSLHGYVTLGTLLAIYRQFPQEKQWQEYGYDLRAMELLWEQARAAQQPEEPRRHVNRVKKTDLDAAIERAAHLEAQLRRAEQESATVRAENERLKNENAKLLGKLEAFESMRKAAA